MCTYGISKDELIEDFEQFLNDKEGDVSALTIAECWNELARKYKWDENIQVINKYSKKLIEE